MRTVEFDAPIANPLPRIRRGPVLAAAGFLLLLVTSLEPNDDRMARSAPPIVDLTPDLTETDLAEARTMGEVQRYLQAEAGRRQAIAAYQRLTEAGVDQPLSAP